MGTVEIRANGPEHVGCKAAARPPECTVAPLAVGWRLGLPAQVPVVATSTTEFDPLTYRHTFGLAQAVSQMLIAHDLDERWAIGVGARLVARTWDDSFGSGKWQIVPSFGIRYSFPEWGANNYFVPAVRYAMSVAGNPSSRKIREAQIAPILNIDLPGR